MLEQIKEKGPIFTFEEYKLMLEILYKIDPQELLSSTPPSSSSKNRRNGDATSNRKLYNENLLELNELMLDYI